MRSMLGQRFIGAAINLEEKDDPKGRTMTLQEITDKSLRARHRRLKRDIEDRVRRGEPYPVVAVCAWALMAVRQELLRRELIDPSWETTEKKYQKQLTKGMGRVYSIK